MLRSIYKRVKGRSMLRSASTAGLKLEFSNNGVNADMYSTESHGPCPLELALYCMHTIHATSWPALQVAVQATLQLQSVERSCCNLLTVQPFTESLDTRVFCEAASAALVLHWSMRYTGRTACTRYTAQAAPRHLELVEYSDDRPLALSAACAHPRPCCPSVSSPSGTSF